MRLVHNACRNERGRKGGAAVVHKRGPIELVACFNVSRIGACAALQPINHFVHCVPRLWSAIMSEVCGKPPWVSASVPGIIAVSLRLQEIRGGRSSGSTDYEIRHQPRVGGVIDGELLDQAVNCVCGFAPKIVTGRMLISLEMVGHPV